MVIKIKTHMTFIFRERVAKGIRHPTSDRNSTEKVVSRSPSENEVEEFVAWLRRSASREKNLNVPGLTLFTAR